MEVEVDSPVEPPSGHPYDPNLAERVSRLEGDMRDMRITMEGLQRSVGEVKELLIRLDERMSATLPHLATKADLAEKPSKTYMWGILAALLTAYACGLAALAILR
jgi:hypothetical protein